MLLAGRTREPILGPAGSRSLPASRMYVKIRDIIPLRITTLRCSGSPSKTRPLRQAAWIENNLAHFSPVKLLMVQDWPHASDIWAWEVTE